VQRLLVSDLRLLAPQWPCVHDAEDLTQAFFQRLMTENALLVAHEQNGNSVSWLLGVLKHLLSDHFRIRGHKNGGRRPTCLVRRTECGERYLSETHTMSDPDTLFTPRLGAGSAGQCA
jgi:DNA-directed RNA polymerase specialized sigma24 family protein